MPARRLLLLTALAACRPGGAAVREPDPLAIGLGTISAQRLSRDVAVLASDAYGRRAVPRLARRGEDAGVCQQLLARAITQHGAAHWGALRDVVDDARVQGAPAAFEAFEPAQAA
jgi:hypothetical protein